MISHSDERQLLSEADRRQVWFGPTVWQDRPAFRLSVSSWRTSDADIDRLIELLRELKRRTPA